MLARLRTHLSYANVMATVAVFIALGGGAIAATTLTSSDGTITACVAKKSGAVKVVAAGKKCPKGTRTLTWNQTGRPGAQGPPGTPGAAGPPGTALAYAHVLANGTLDLAHSKGVNGISKLCIVPCTVTHGESAAQCFDLATSAANGVVTTAPEGPFWAVATVQVPAPVAEGINVGCPADYADAEVFTVKLGSGEPKPNAFYVVFN
jgi:ethanolamine utilization microcompartment shell protein EutS